jgi:hypothetical protein
MIAVQKHAKIFSTVQSLTVITQLELGITDGVSVSLVSINVWRLAGDILNITGNFLYCNNQVHRDFLIILYFSVTHWMLQDPAYIYATLPARGSLQNQVLQDIFAGHIRYEVPIKRCDVTTKTHKCKKHTSSSKRARTPPPITTTPHKSRYNHV